MGTQQTIQFASLGMADSLILMVLALVVFGPRRLPQIGRQIGKLMYEFRKASNDFKFQMEEELRNAEEADRRQKEEERLKALALAAPAPETPNPDTPTSDTPAVDTPAAAAEATTPAASPYPWESVYPPTTAPATDSASATEIAPAIEPQAESTELQVHPPSTGETIPAASPKRVRRKRTPKPPAAETVVGAPEQPKQGAGTVDQGFSPGNQPIEAAGALAPEVNPSPAIESTPAPEQPAATPEHAQNG
jgi:sec-independent protein translocase protein TatB